MQFGVDPSFYFDKGTRKLRYQGRIDDMENSKRPIAVWGCNAIDAPIERRKEVPVAMQFSAVR